MQASPNERKKFAFQFFDFDGSKAITVDELVIMLRSTLVGLAKLTGGEAITPMDPLCRGNILSSPPLATGICPSVSECEELADQVMETADSIVKDSMITCVLPHWLPHAHTDRPHLHDHALVYAQLCRVLPVGARDAGAPRLAVLLHSTRGAQADL